MSPENQSIQRADKVGTNPSAIYKTENPGFGPGGETLSMQQTQATIMSDRRSSLPDISEISAGLVNSPPRQPSTINTGLQQRGYPPLPQKEAPQPIRRPSFIRPKGTNPST
jgi:hypothetical protein